MNPQAPIEPNTAPLPCSTVRTHDIIPGRGKVDHQGNVMFRKLVAERVAEYKHLQNKGDRPGTLRLVRTVIDQVRQNGGRFLDKNWKNEVRLYVIAIVLLNNILQWVEMSEKERIDKADRALRDASRNVAKRGLGSTKPLPNTQMDATITGMVVRPAAAPAVFDDSIFDPPPDEIPSQHSIYNDTSCNHQHQHKKPPADLEYSCSSLFEVKSAMATLADATHNSSSSSLSVTDLEERNEADSSLHSLQKFIKPMIDSSAMSLDYLALEQHTSVDWLPDGSKRTSGLEIDEDMLVDSFNQSLDFNAHRAASQQKQQRHSASSSS